MAKQESGAFLKVIVQKSIKQDSLVMDKYAEMVSDVKYFIPLRKH